MAHESKISVDRESQNKWSIKSWLNKHNVSHLQQLLLKHDLQSLEKCIALATTNNIEQKISQLLKEIPNCKSKGEDLINLQHAFDSLLKIKLKKTKDFLSKLNDISRLNIYDQADEWTLIFVDCDDVESLLQEKKINVDNVENSISLLVATIYKLITKHENKDEMFGYHLGGDLFALFVNDNHIMTKSKQVVEYLINTMANKDKSSLTISAGIGIRTLLPTKNNCKQEKDKEKQNELNFEKIQREWVVRAHTNLLRAKENGKNCYFFNLVCVYHVT